jgi:hypothetical protein
LNEASWELVMAWHVPETGAESEWYRADPAQLPNLDPLLEALADQQSWRAGVLPPLRGLPLVHG